MMLIFRSLHVRHPVSDWDDATGYLCQIPDPDGRVNQLIDRIQEAVAERDDSDDVSIEFDEHEADIMHSVFAAIDSSGMIPTDRPMTPRYRWECPCTDPPVLLARYEPGGVVEMKCRDRWYYVTGGTVQAVCPKCGRYHDGPPDANGNGMG